MNRQTETSEELTATTEVCGLVSLIEHSISDQGCQSGNADHSSGSLGAKLTSFINGVNALS